ncbi:hypothetical protein BDZ91DRAFT_802582 [Kalaharituber pfeilii]|nr:hypothetical protein BDZ91DRAFT_802582 [Kalaharituber pfeilii]
MPPKGRNRPPPPQREAPKPRSAPRIPEWYILSPDLRARGLGWETIVASMWKGNMASEEDPKKGSFLCFTFGDDLDDIDCKFGGPDQHHATPAAPPTTTPMMGFSPVTTIHPAEPTPEALGFSPIHTALAEEPSPPPAAIPAVTPMPTGNRNKKRKGQKCYLAKTHMPSSAS